MAFKGIDFNKVKQQINDIPLKKLRLMGNEIIVDIINRTQSGKDINNKTFKPYTKQYAQIKKRFGGKVNLTVTGNMLNSIDSKTIPNGLRFYINSTNEKKKALGNIKNGRRFMGIDSKLKAKIKQRISK